MSLEGLLDAIRAAGDAQVREIEAEAQRRADEILQAVQTQAQQQREAAVARAGREAERQRARLMHRARLDAQQTLEKARQAVMDVALEQIQDRLRAARADAGYPADLSRLVLEALNALNGSLGEDEEGQVHADPRDVALVREVLLQAGKAVPVCADLQTAGGVAATSDDGRVRADNTLEARLRLALPELRPHLVALAEREAEAEVEKREAAIWSDTT